MVLVRCDALMLVIFPSGIDEKLIEEVLGLDLFDHDGVTYKVADLGNACWVERLGPGAMPRVGKASRIGRKVDNGVKVCCYPTLGLEI